MLGREVLKNFSSRHKSIVFILPLLTHQSLPQQGEYAIWNIEESEDFFRDQLQLFNAELEQVNRIKGEGRRLEWLASHYLIHLMSGRKKEGGC